MSDSNNNKAAGATIAEKKALSGNLKGANIHVSGGANSGSGIIDTTKLSIRNPKLAKQLSRGSNINSGSETSDPDPAREALLLGTNYNRGVPAQHLATYQV